MTRPRLMAITAVLALLSPTPASGGPPTSGGIGTEPDPPIGWVCDCLCYGACVLVGKSGAQCDAACTDSCFTIVTSPTCDSGTDRVCAAERVPMRRTLNILGAVVLVLLLVLRRRFASAIRELAKPADERRRAPDLLVMVGAAAVVIVAFLALSAWALVVAGYWVVALLLVVHVALVLTARP